MKLPGGSDHQNHSATTPEEQPVSPPTLPTTETPGVHTTECDQDRCANELSEEYLIPQKQRVLEGEVRFHKNLEEVVQHLAVDAEHDEVYVEHVPINQVVSRRLTPWQEEDSIVVPIYEEQVVVTKRLVLKEKLRIRRVKAVERQHISERVRRERPVFEESGRQGTVHEGYSTDTPNSEEPSESVGQSPRPELERKEPESGGIFDRLAEKWDHVA